MKIKINIEEQFKKLLNTSSDTIDSDVFLKNMHSERLRRSEKKVKLFHGALSFCFIIVLGFITMNHEFMTCDCVRIGLEMKYVCEAYGATQAMYHLPKCKII